MKWKWHAAEAAILLAVALLNALWVDYFFDPIPSIYITGLVQALMTIAVLFVSKLLFHKRRRDIMKAGKNTGGKSDGT